MAIAINPVRKLAEERSAQEGAAMLAFTPAILVSAVGLVVLFPKQHLPYRVAFVESLKCALQCALLGDHDKASLIVSKV